MANSTCSIASISDLLNKGDRFLLNVTTTIAACPSICSLAWGSGNPDLSGIGVNISYIMQAILALLCGPILAVIYSYRSRHDTPTQDRLPDILNTFVDTSAAFNIPVAIAAVIRLCQYAALYEQYFVLFLVGMQLCSFVAVVCAVAVFEKRHCRIIQKISLYLGIQGLLLCVMYVLQMRSISRWVSIKELIGGCKGYSQIVPFFIIFKEQSSKPTLYQMVQWIMMFIIAVPLLLGVFFSFKAPRRLLLRRSKSSPQGIQRIDRKRGFVTFIAAFIMTLMTLLMIALIWLLQTMRRKLKATARGDFQDDQWGFGQIIAVFIWVPLCLQVIYCAMCFAWSRFCLNSGRRVQGLATSVNRIAGVFTDDPDESEIDYPKHPQVISQVKVQSGREYIALEEDNLRNTEFGRGRWS